MDIGHLTFVLFSFFSIISMISFDLFTWLRTSPTNASISSITLSKSSSLGNSNFVMTMAMVSTIIYECEYNNLMKAYGIVTFLTASFKITPSSCWPPSVLSFSAILKRLFKKKKNCSLGRRVVTSHKRLFVTSLSQILTFESKSKSYLWICLNELSYLWICCFQLLTRPSQALLLYFFLLSGVLHSINDYHYHH